MEFALVETALRGELLYLAESYKLTDIYAILLLQTTLVREQVCMESDQSFKLGVPASLLKTEIIRIILPLSLVCGVKLSRFIVHPPVIPC